MKLANVQVWNHSRLQDVSIQVRKHLVLVGANDVGKSSLLRCLDLLLGASAAQLYARITADDFRDRAEPLRIEATLNDFTADDRALFPDEISVSRETGAESLTVQLLVEVDASDTLAINRTAPSGGTGRQLSREQVQGLGWRFLSATAQTRDLREDRKSPLDDILQAIDLGDEKVKFEAVTETLAAALRNSQVLSQVRTDLSGQLSKALPDQVAVDDLSFVPGATADDDVLSDVRLQVRKGSETHSVSEQSDGTRALYAIALYDLLSAGASVVAIDEPEVHLHPTSQRSLARLLLGNNQKVVATHSADIVSAFDPDSIVVVRAGGVVIQPDEGFLSDDDKFAVHWWVRDRLEPLTSRRVVAVEGISDRVILQRVADLTDRNLDRLGVSVVETSGSGSMPVIDKLFGDSGFNIPLSRLIDADAMDETAAKLGVDPADLSDHGVFNSFLDLEDEYVHALGADALWEALKHSGMFSKKELQNCRPTGADGQHLAPDIADFCRHKKRKVSAAIVAARLMTRESALEVDSVISLLDSIDHE